MFSSRRVKSAPRRCRAADLHAVASGVVGRGRAKRPRFSAQPLVVTTATPGRAAPDGSLTSLPHRPAGQPQRRRADNRESPGSSSSALTTDTSRYCHIVITTAPGLRLGARPHMQTLCNVYRRVKLADRRRRITDSQDGSPTTSAGGAPAENRAGETTIVCSLAHFGCFLPHACDVVASVSSCTGLASRGRSSP